jgi:ribosomal protein S18 acetylase RimI-like enzyme
MDARFRKAELPREIRSLLIFDHKAFREYPADWFDHDEWKAYESWWLIVGRRKIGCCAFDRFPAPGRRQPRSLFIVSTGILPDFRGQGFGALIKRWQILYARRHGFRRIVTTTRKSNRAMLGLNRKFGFKILRMLPRYYAQPSEPAVVMELRL